MSTYVKKLVKQAKAASYKLANLTTFQKNKALESMAKSLMDNRKAILKENKKDIEKAIAGKLKSSFIERLSLDDERLKSMSVSLEEIAKLDDPVGKVISTSIRPNGIELKKVRVPIGVILIVYEARPNVTSDCSGLLFKTSNVGILRGGKNSFYSNKIIGRTLTKALKLSGIDFDAFFVVENTERKIVDELLKQNEYIDLVIPRGGETLIRKVVKSSYIPVIKHYKGVCHVYVDKDADLGKALKICVNAKVQRPSVCNALETILIHQDVAKEFLPHLKQEFDRYSVQVKAGQKAQKFLKGAKKATQKDWSTEYLDLIVSIKIVNDLEEAIEHINFYGSHHTDTIVTENAARADKFVNNIDSACCFANISTRFSDGYQFGLGAEIGISTDKLHARGPMGLEELTIYKWIAKGNGQLRG